MKLDYIPIYKGEMLPTKTMWFHTKGTIPFGATNIEDFRNKMIESALNSTYLADANCVIVIENGQVIDIIQKKKIAQEKIFKKIN